MASTTVLCPFFFEGFLCWRNVEEIFLGHFEERWAQGQIDYILIEG